MNAVFSLGLVQNLLLIVRFSGAGGDGDEGGEVALLLADFNIANQVMGVVQMAASIVIFVLYALQNGPVPRLPPTFCSMRYTRPQKSVREWAAPLARCVVEGRLRSALNTSSAHSDEHIPPLTLPDADQRVCEAVTRKVHADLLLRLVDSLPDRLLQRVEEGFEGAAGFDLETAREHLHGRREQLSREQLRVSRMLLTFQRVARVYAPAPAGKAALRG